ncbi:Thymidine kinase [Monocercomonoides exilis]|uniref:Thymidine kinase n=1 Tax=Monocercomonoides exilis TaxID=2049356 RepID=UPI00355A6A49|nr:Thymidine kinase [Monocercomonoides exilis]|eukprot:MONOS_4603.1-p1 / transcript=MONOS_4603.1 / gene=MONOS_4603 / organism=Monocercomonoides_exilis_PA203 / gene_product=Thymidine kinase [EC:2.7.1.21] / transcript_product=Thymidine kinase [EC:2.7.1.21] / location=Mono_scaffold00124:62959-63672(-) / protein_length=238 / sequence_SO=supercontig / SO=protein_coding / is_pseudo=false
MFSNACISVTPTSPSPVRTMLSKDEKPVGSIELIIGPMFSGKTTELMRRIRRHSLGKRSCVVIKYKKDCRYSEDKLSTHDRSMCEAISCSRLQEAENFVKMADVIGVDEGQFYPDLLEFCEAQANDGKIVIVSALDGTFQRKRFNDVVDLIPMCESVVKLTSVCMICGGTAAFSKRIVADKSVELVGGAEAYTAVCRKCYFDLDKKPSPINTELVEKVCENEVLSNPLTPPLVSEEA